MGEEISAVDSVGSILNLSEGVHSLVEIANVGKTKVCGSVDDGAS